MPVIQLAGCRSDSLLGYLKALGVLRLVGTQADPSVRGMWIGSRFALDSELGEEAVRTFFLESYAPTPILNPWNNGAGFDEKPDAASNTLRKIVESNGPRWEPYRRAIEFVVERYVNTGLRARYLAENDGKRLFVRELRRMCPEAMLPWLDAVIVLASNRVAYPYLFGSGGNDGRLDFSRNFAARALDVCGDNPTSQTAQMLSDSLKDTAESQLLRDAIGQFSSRHAGGANSANGFSAESLVNPWDYMLLLEGALLFNGAIGRRSDRTRGNPIFPFALRGVSGGHGTASDQEPTRGEVWLPIWSGYASLHSVSDLLRKGRIDLPSGAESPTVRSAALASEAATAVVTLGVQLGIRQLERVSFVQRNGLAFSAAALGTIEVGKTYDRGIAIVSTELGGWVDRVRRINLGLSAREALRRLNEALLAFPNLPRDRRAAARQGLLVAIADLDRALARSRGADREIQPAPRLRAEVVSSLNDSTPVHRAAMAIASLGSLHLYTDTRDELRHAGDDAARSLRDLLARRIREDANDAGAGWLEPSCRVSLDDAVAFLSFDRSQRRRFNDLLRAYSLIRLAEARVELAQTGDFWSIPACYALLKLVFDNRNARDERILRLMFARSPGSALRLAVQRARTISELPRSPRNISRIVIEDPAWMAAALALPVDRSVRTQHALFRAALAS